MNAELFIKKALLQIKKGQTDKAVESMNKTIEIGDDIVSVVQAHCFLGEYYFINQDYISAKYHLEWISEQQDEFETDYDDLLNEEIDRAEMLLDMIGEFSLIN